MSGLAPMTFSDESSVLAIPDVSAVNDPTVRRMFYFLMEENRKVHCALNHSIQASNAATAQLQSVSEALDVTREQLAVLNENLYGNRVLPVLINAGPNGSPIGTLSSSAGCSGVSGGSNSSSKSDCSFDGPLKCPFCPHCHKSERVHHQHMVRLLDRFVAKFLIA